jgi:hypothetical protein
MKVQPVSSPHAVMTTQSNPTAQRNKAIEAFTKGQSSYDKPANPAPNHSVNPNNISPEELSAVKPQEVYTLAETEVTEKAPETVEPPKEAKPEQDPVLQRQFAQLARQERQLRAKAQQQDQAIKAREAALQAKEDAVRAKETEYSQGYISKDQLKRDTMRILADAGVSYDELTQQILNQPGVDPRTEALVSRLEAKIAALEAKADQNVKAQEESQQQAYKAAVKQIEMDVRTTVQNDPNFETIKATRSIQDVVELIETTYKQDGILMTVEDACTEVEKYLVDEALKVTRIGKIKRQLEQAGTPKPTQTAVKPADTPSMKTLTNAATSTRKLSARERAMLAFKNELK